MPGARTQVLARDELFLVIPAHGPHARAEPATESARLADLASIPWILDPASVAAGQWARDTCRAAGFEPDVRYAASDLLLQVHLAEKGHAAAVVPGLLLTAIRRRPPGCAPCRGTRGAGSPPACGPADRDPAVRAFRSALGEAVRATIAIRAAADDSAGGEGRRAEAGGVPAAATLILRDRPPRRTVDHVPDQQSCQVRIEPGDRVVVTGAAGFIGSAVVRAARARGAHVVAMTEPRC